MARRSKAALHPAKQYIEDVLAGRVLTNKYVRFAVERHLRDLEHGPKRGLCFDEEAGQHVIDFFQYLHHSQGEWGGTPIILEPWEQFILWVLFGWKRKNGTRRFRKALIEIARKNGKSLLCSGIALYLLVADGEPGAQVYAAAADKEQARIVFGESRNMVGASPELNEILDNYRNSIVFRDNLSTYKVLSADAHTKHGFNSHGIIFDELHAQPTRELWDVLQTSTSARRQPLTVSITTAGFDKLSICYEEHAYVQRILEGVLEDDATFGIIYAIDEEDDWKDPKNWIKANPNLGVSKKLEYLETEFAKAKEIPAYENTFKRLELNVWTEQEERLLQMEVWDEGKDPLPPIEDLKYRPAYVGIDMASNEDVAAIDVAIPLPDGRIGLYAYLFVPKETALRRQRAANVPYLDWIRDGYLIGTEGNTIDHGAFKQKLDWLSSFLDIRAVAIDRWGALEFIQWMADRCYNVIPHGQGYASMTSPTKDFLKCVLDRKIVHGGHVGLRWMASNVAAEQDAAGNIKPSKKKSKEKIDGIVAGIMAVGQLTVRETAASPYENRGLKEI